MHECILSSITDDPYFNGLNARVLGQLGTRNAWESEKSGRSSLDLGGALSCLTKKKNGDYNGAAAAGKRLPCLHCYW